MEASNEILIDLFLNQAEQLSFLADHTPPRVRPASWASISELSEGDRSALLEAAIELESFESTQEANMLVGIGAEILLGCEGELVDIRDQYADRSHIMMDVGAYLGGLEEEGARLPERSDLTLLQEWIAVSPYVLWEMKNKLHHAIDSFIRNNTLMIASGRGFLPKEERKLSNKWKEMVLEWRREAVVRIDNGQLSFTPSPFEEGL